MFSFFRNRAVKIIATPYGQASLDQAVISLTNFSLGILAARILGAYEYGVFALALSLLFLALETHMAFLTVPLLTLASHKTGDENYLPSMRLVNLFFSMGIALLMGLFSLITALFFPEWRLAPLSLYIFLYIFVRLGYDFGRKVYFSHGHVHKALLADCMISLGTVILFSSFWYLNALTLPHLMLCYIIPNSIVLVIQNRFFFFSPWPRLAHIKKGIYEHWQFGGWLIGSAAAKFFSMNYLYFLAGTVLSMEAVGHVRVAYYVIALIMILYMAMDNILPRRAARAMNEKGIKYMETTVIKNCGLFAGIAIFYAVFVWIWADDVVLSVLGKEYIAAIPLMKAFSITSVFLSFAIVPQQLLRAIGKTKAFFTAYVIIAMLHIFLGVRYLEVFKEMGIVMAFGVLQIIVFVTLSAYYLSERQKIVKAQA